MKFEEKNARFYNFNKHSDKERECCVYFLIKNDEVIYVGKTIQGISRPLSHNDKDFDSFYMINCKDNELDIKEVEMICKYKPKFNKGISPIEGLFSTSQISYELKLRGFFLRHPFIKYALSKSGIDYLTFRQDFFIYKKDLNKAIEFIEKTHQILRVMQVNSIKNNIPQKCIDNFNWLIESQDNELIKDFIYFGIIKENEIEFINDYVEKNNLRANFALPNYEIPELTKYRKFRLNYDLVENYKAQDENLLIEFCQKNKIRITR